MPEIILRVDDVTMACSPWGALTAYKRVVRIIYRLGVDWLEFQTVKAILAFLAPLAHRPAVVAFSQDLAI